MSVPGGTGVSTCRHKHLPVGTGVSTGRHKHLPVGTGVSTGRDLQAMSRGVGCRSVCCIPSSAHILS